MRSSVAGNYREMSSRDWPAFQVRSWPHAMLPGPEARITGNRARRISGGTYTGEPGTPREAP